MRPNQLIRDTRSGKKKTLAYYAAGPHLCWQIDLADLHKPAGQRGHYAFLLTAIDVFTRQGECKLVYDKSGLKVTKAFHNICARKGIWPVNLQSDKGKEFFNANFAKYCREKKINHYYVSSENKAAVVERFNRSLQGLIYRYRMFFPKVKIAKIVSTAVRNYNATPHRHHRLQPVKVEGTVASRLMRSMLTERSRLAEKNSLKAQQYAFKVGQTVRTTREKKTFFKGYRGTYTEEVFIVTRCFRRFPQTDVNLYTLKDLTGRPIKNSIYYEHELQRVELPAEAPVRKVFKRGKKGKKSVALKDYPRDHFEWR